MEFDSAKGNSKTVVITGASSGIGRATAHAFARMGSRIGLIGRNRQALIKTLEEVRSQGGEGLILPLDVSDFEQVNEAASKVEAAFGPIDIWVNNAMVSMMAPFEQMKPIEFERITSVTYLGYVWGTLAALQRMKARNYGVIVQVGSALAYRSIPLQSAYCGAKHAIRGWTESIRCELIHDQSKVHITMVQLPGVNTPQFNWVLSRMPKKSKPVGTIYQPQVAAQAVVWAALHPRKEFWVGFPTVQSVLGQKFFASLLDSYLAKRVYRDHFTDENEPQCRANNLFNPVPTDYGMEGPYSQEAKSKSFEFLLSKRKKMIFTIGFLVSTILLLRRKLMVAREASL